MDRVIEERSSCGWRGGDLRATTMLVLFCSSIDITFDDPSG